MKYITIHLCNYMYIDKIMLVDENFIQIVITNTQIISDLQYIGVMKCDEM